MSDDKEIVPEIIAKLPELMVDWNEVYEEATPHLKLKGKNLVEAQANLPGHLGYYIETWKSIDNVYSRVNKLVKKKHGMLFRYYLEKYPRELGARDIEQYISSDQDYVDMLEHLDDINFYRGNFEGLVEGFKSQNWMLGHIAKLELAGIEDVVI